MRRQDNEIFFHMPDHRRIPALPEEMSITRALRFRRALHRVQADLEAELAEADMYGSETIADGVPYNTIKSMTGELQQFLNRLTQLLAPELAEELTPEMFEQPQDQPEA
jgi:hypothetical protein